MKLLSSISITAILAAPSFAQDVVSPKALAIAQIDAAEAVERIGKIDTVELEAGIAGLKDRMAFLQDRTGPFARTKTFRSDGGAYDAGTSALDQHHYEAAIERFDNVIADKAPRADGALYWKAYALNRIGRRDDALTALAALRRDYPASHWLNDAQALQVELKQSTGQPVSPSQEANEDLKLMAINSLMNADPDRAMPLLEDILKGSSSPKIKDRALFVLTQNRSPKARQILMEYAKGAGNPDLQIRAIRYVGMAGTAETQQDLSAIYAASSDFGVKREIIRSMMVSNGKDPLFSLAKSEKDETLKREAIRQLGAMRATDQVAQLYAGEPNAKVKSEIVNTLGAQGDAKALVDLARKEADPAMKREIVGRLASMRNKEATDYMMELLK